MIFFKYLRPLFIWLFVLSAGLANAQSVDGITDTSITIGMSGPFTGPNGAYGTEMQSIIKLYFDQINHNGGIFGRKLQLIALDDGYETDRAVANTKILIEKEKVFALTGYYGSSPTTAAMEVFSAAKVPLIGTISGSGALRSPTNRYLFHVRASYANETDQIVKQLASIGLTSIGVLYQNDGFGKSGLEGVTAALKKMNMVPSVVASVERNSTDVQAAVAAMVKIKPQAIVLVTLYKPTAEFVRQVNAANLHPYFATLSPVGADNLARELGPLSRGIMISQVMPYPWDDTKPVVHDYKKMVEKSDGKLVLSYYGLEGYIDARVLVEAIKSSGKNLTREKLVDNLETMHNLNIGGFSISYSSTNHDGSQFVDMTVLGANGKVIR